MIKLGINVTDATGETGSIVAAEPLESGHPVRIPERREDGRSAQLKEKGRLVKLFTIAALFLLSISTRAALAGEIKPYNQPEFDKLAAAGKPILLDFRADWCTICAAQAPVIRKLMAEGKYQDLTAFTIDFDRDAALLKAYNVELQSTLIVLTGKHEEGRSVGDTSREGIDRLLNSVAH
jgi:thiol-disulfide isomerase/thioredoxin